MDFGLTPTYVLDIDVQVHSNTGTPLRSVDFDLNSMSDGGVPSMGTDFSLASDTVLPFGSIIYTDYTGDSGTLSWESTGGTVTIGAVVGNTFSFTVQNATMAVNSGAGVTNTTGTFTLNGTGMASFPMANTEDAEAAYTYPAGCPCALLATCCSMISNTGRQEACYTGVNIDTGNGTGNIACLAQLESYEQSKSCP
jgi:hypothetical protein